MPTLRRSICRLSIAVMLGLGLTAVVLLGFLLTKVESSVTACPPSSQAAAGSPTGIITAVGRHLERDGVPFEVRGVNYYPKDYAWHRFWLSYTAATTQISTELDLAKALGGNAVRIFVPYELFGGSDQAAPYLGHLADFVDRLRVRDMVAIVTFFDFYASVSSTPYSTTDYLTNTHHISAVVNTLGTTNTAILAWDIKNELDRDYAHFDEDEVKAWATEMISYTRGLDANHLVTIGFYGAVSGTLCYDPAVTDTLVYSPAIAAEFAPLVDFVSMHYFLSERCFESDLQALQSRIGDKPIVLEEFGLHTLISPDDPHTETEQAAYYNTLLSLSEAHGVAGYLFWTLTDFSYILPDSQESHYCQGILRNSNVTVCQVTSTRDYTRKPGADTVCRHYDDRVAYLDLFDSWVVSDTDEAPAGWSDNWRDGGALLRGYNLSNTLCSQHQGKVAFAKFVTNATSITGLAASPVLTNVNVDRYPILAGQIYSYSIRDRQYGSDAILYLGVQEGSQITRLLTITPGSPVPNPFRIDLRRSPTVWSGTHNFTITFELVPEGLDDGYSAAYEFDWIALESAVCDTLTNPLAISLDIRDTFGPRLLQPGGYSRYDFHRGLDWQADEYVPVHAVTTGTVRSFRDDWASGIGSGNFVHLTHQDVGGNDYETRYNHLAAVHCAITNGLQVLPGQLIGWVGHTGAHYDHLHFEVRQGQGLTVTQRAAIHPLSTSFLPWANDGPPTVTLLGVYTDATGLTALVEVTSPYTQPDVTTVSVTVSGAVTGSRTIDYVDLNANTAVVADLDDPLVNDVCIIPADLNAANDYLVTMAFRRLGYSLPATVTARATDVDGWYATDTANLTGGLEVTPSEQIARGVPGQTVTFVYTLTNRTGVSDTFTPAHLSAQGWPAVVTPVSLTLDNGQSRTITVSVTLNTATFGPPDCGLLVAEAHSGTRRVTAGFFRIYRDAYVSTETGSDVPGCGSMITPCATIGYAISQTDAGGTIHVAQGIYTENLTLTKTIDLLGGYTSDWVTRSLVASSTTVDGNYNGAVLVIDGDYGPLIEGFTFVNGHLHGHAGGGVRLVGGAAPTLHSNWILSNTADLSGGGIYVGPYGTLPPTIISNTIAGNTSASSSGGGGGIYVKDRPALIQGNVISDNQATANDGGGIYLTGNTTAQVLGNHILDNEANDDGGGVMVRSSGVYLANNVIRYNTAGDDGNGIAVFNSSAPRIYNNTLVANHPESGAGLYIATDSTPTVINNIVATHEVGVHCSSPVTVSFSVLSNTIDIDGCIDSHNIRADPRLSDEVHLAPDSPAIDAGTNVGVNDDIDGESRPVGDDYDIGADEFPAALTVTKQASPNPVAAGAQLTYTLRVTNTGNVTLTAIITDTLPNRVTHVTATDVLTWAPTITAPGGIWMKQFSVTVAMGYSGTLTNEVRVTTTEGATGVYTETSIALVPHLTVTKQAEPEPVVAGARLTYTLTVTNSGAITATNVVVTDTVPAGTITWEIPTVSPSDGTAQVTFVVTTCQSITNDSYRVVTSSQGITSGLGAPVTTMITTPTIAISFSPASICRGPKQPITFTGTSTTNGDPTFAWGWDFGDNRHIVISSTATVSHSYITTGTYTVTLTVMDTCGFTGTKMITNAVRVPCHIYLPIIMKNHS